MRVKRLGWLGVRTDAFDEMVGLLRDVMGVSLELDEPGRAMFKMADGDPVDVFHTSVERYEMFTTGPVVGFVVDDVEQGARELAQAGVEVFDVQRGDGFMWVHFRGPDGNLYELQSADPPS